MKNLIVIKFLICLTAINTFAADFNGNWKGSGYAISGDGLWKLDCKSITILINQKNDEIMVGNLKYACDSLDGEWVTTIFKVEKNIIFSEGQIAGVLGPNSFSVTAVNGYINSIINFTVNAAGQLLFQEQIVDVSARGLGFISINGTLKKE